MAVYVPNFEKPTGCITERGGQTYRCPFLTFRNVCQVQEDRTSVSWSERYARCPLVQLKDAKEVGA